MEITSIIQGTNLVEIVNSVSNSGNSKKINEIDLKFNVENFEKYISPDQKNVAVSENFNKSFKNLISVSLTLNFILNLSGLIWTLSQYVSILSYVKQY